MIRFKLISIVAIFLIALLVFPATIKTMHQHHFEHSNDFDAMSTVAFNTQHEHCLTCDFEFVSFLAETLPEVSYDLSDFRILCVPASYIRDFSKLIFYSLRAPPAVNI